MTLTMAVKATYEVLGQDVSDLAILTIVEELEQYPEADVKTALARCRKELRKVTLADILYRLPTGHPGVEEAWGIVSPLLGNEDASVVWTDEMRESYGAVAPLKDDLVAARMAFKEVYSKAMGQARAERRKVSWKVSLGLDPYGRQTAIEQAVVVGRLTQDHARKLIPDFTMPEVSTLPAVKGF